MKEIPMLLIVSGKKGLKNNEEDEGEDEEDDGKLKKALANSKGLPPILLVSRK